MRFCSYGADPIFWSLAIKIWLLRSRFQQPARLPTKFALAAEQRLLNKCIYTHIRVSASIFQ